MKRKLYRLLLIFIFLAGFCVLVYPAVGHFWNMYRNSKLLNTYEENVSELDPEDYSEILAEARIYNEAQMGNTLPDAFAEAGETLDDVYLRMLNLGGDGVMGYLEIPKIDIKILIYHGTAEDVLSHGAGHMQGSSLPIGGVNTHAVLAAHRGLPSEKLFTDLDILEAGDVFFINVLDQILAYEIDQTIIVEPTDTDALSIVRDKDYVTLVTCTPYGVNTQRLLVRGHRIDYEQEIYDQEVAKAKSSIKTNYVLVAILGLSVVCLVAFVMFILGRRRKKQ